MNQLEDILKEFDFSKEFEDFVLNTERYTIYDAQPDAIEIEIEQQKVVSSNNIYYSTLE